MVRYLFYTIGDLTYQSPLVVGIDVMALITYYDNLNRSLPSERSSVFYCCGDTYLSLDVANAWNRNWDSYKMVYRTNINHVCVF